MTPDHEMAADLIWIIWKSVPATYKSRYRANIWRQLEDNVRGSAYTNNLSKFANDVCAKFDTTLGRNVEDRQRALNILRSGNDRRLLQLLRDETTVIVLMVRVRNQEHWASREIEEE